MDTLYTSEAIRRAVRSTLTARNGRRVVIVAFVGNGAEAYLPHPRKGIELYCWPSASGTSAKAVGTLQRLGVDVFFVPRLHMKIYWSSRGGAVVTSANLSTNAYGQGNLREFGVHVPSKSIDIDKIINSLRARPVTPASLRALEVSARQIVRGGRRIDAPLSFPDWFDARPRRPWRLIATEGHIGASAALKKVAKRDRPDGEIADWVSTAHGELREEGHALCLEFKSKKVVGFGWMFVHRIVRVQRRDRAYERGCPYQAAQIHRRRACPPEPFAIDARFRRALRKVVAESSDAETDRWRGRPPVKLLRRLRELY